MKWMRCSLGQHPVTNSAMRRNSSKEIFVSWSWSNRVSIFFTWDLIVMVFAGTGGHFCARSYWPNLDAERPELSNASMTSSISRYPFLFTSTFIGERVKMLARRKHVNRPDLVKHPPQVSVAQTDKVKKNGERDDTIAIWIFNTDLGEKFGDAFLCVIIIKTGSVRPAIVRYASK